jgi:hypothetical protein
MARQQQSWFLITIVIIVAAVIGYLLTDLAKHSVGGSVDHYNVVCHRGNITRMTVEYEQPFWWCENCKTFHLTSATIQE